MVNYFKELEEPRNQFITITRMRIFNRQTFIINTIPPQFFDKYFDVFMHIENLDLMHDKNDKQLKEYTGDYIFYRDGIPEPQMDEITFSYFISDCISLFEDFDGLSENGVFKIVELLNEFKKYNTIQEYNRNLFYYYIYIKDFFKFHNKFIVTSKSELNEYIFNTCQILKCQNRLTERDKEIFKEMLDYIHNLRIDITEGNLYEKYDLPNAWFITPFNHLYNCMGPTGHGEANLIYPLYYSVYRNNIVKDHRTYINEIEDIIKKGYVTKSSFKHYTHIYDDSPLIRDEDYYRKDHSKPREDDYLDEKYYNKGHVKLILGMASAHASFWKFFDYLYKNSTNYSADIEYLKPFIISDILVRCCGFHKVSSILDKTITTSCINYEEQFKEYIDRGWKIDFVKPIVLNPVSRRLEEYNDDFLMIRKVLKNRMR